MACVQQYSGLILKKKRLWWQDCDFTLIILVDYPVSPLNQCEVDLHSRKQPLWNISPRRRRVRENSGSWKSKFCL